MEVYICDLCGKIVKHPTKVLTVYKSIRDAKGGINDDGKWFVCKECSDKLDQRVKENSKRISDED